MGTFAELIKEENISVLQLMKKSLITIKEDFGAFVKATLLFSCVWVIFSIVALAASTFLVTSEGQPFELIGILVYVVVAFVGSLYIQSFGNMLVVDVYYTVLGYPSNSRNKTVGDYVKKTLSLVGYIFVICIALGIIFSIVLYILSLVLGIIAIVIGGDAGLKFVLVVTFILDIIMLIVYAVVMMIGAGAALEYFTSDKRVGTCVSNAFKIASYYTWGYFKKATAFVLAITLYLFLVSYILYYLMHLILGEAAQAQVLSSGQFGSVHIGGSEILLLVLIFILIVISLMIIIAFYFVYSIGYYVNLNYQEGNGILGLKKAKKEPNNTQKVERLREEIKASDDREITNSGQMEMIELVDPAEPVEPLEVVEEQPKVTIPEIENIDEVTKETGEVDEIKTKE